MTIVPDTSTDQRLSFIELQTQLFDLYRRATQTAAATSRAALSSEFEALVQPLEGSAQPDALRSIRRYRRLITLATGQTTAPKAPGLPRVVTSLNPFGRTETQMRAFRKWQALGLTVRTYNHVSEVEALTKLGLRPDEIVTLDDAETGAALYGKPVPAIRAVLQRASLDAPDGVLLVNADLYPAAQDTAFVEAWRTAGPAVALTRLDVLRDDWPLMAHSRPYHGGLDGFLLDPRALKRLLIQLDQFTVSRQMCFGIVGWDFLTGALIQERLGGTFLDSGMLLHQTHPTTYANVDGFAPYVPAMHSLGIGLGGTHEDVAAAFYDRIIQTCTDNRHRFAAPLPQPDGDPDQLPVAVRQTRDALRRIAPVSALCAGQGHVTGLAMSVAARPDLGFDALLAHLEGDEPARAFSRILMLLVAWQRLRPLPDLGLTKAYPKTSRHADAVALIKDRPDGDPLIQRRDIAHLFATELALYGIFNPRLYDYLVLAARHDEDRGLLAEIRTFVTEHLADDAA